MYSCYDINNIFRITISCVKILKVWAEPHKAVREQAPFILSFQFPKLMMKSE